VEVVRLHGLPASGFMGAVAEQLRLPRGIPLAKETIPGGPAEQWETLMPRSQTPVPRAMLRLACESFPVALTPQASVAETSDGSPWGRPPARSPKSSPATAQSRQAAEANERGRGFFERRHRQGTVTRAASTVDAALRP
jgi:hypothetical protein